MKTCLLTVAIFASLLRQFSLMVTDIHYIDYNELPPVCNTRVYVLRILVDTYFSLCLEIRISYYLFGD